MYHFSSQLIHVPNLSLLLMTLQQIRPHTLYILLIYQLYPLYIIFSLSTPLIYLTVFPQYIPILVPIITLTHPNIAPTIIHIVAGDSSIPPIFNNSYYINNYLVLTIFFTFLLV